MLKYFVLCLGFGVLCLGALAQSVPALVVTPEVGLIESPVTIRLTGLTSGKAVTVRAAIDDVQDVRWEAYAVFTADEAGEVDVETAIPQEGTYQDADGLGLFWSMLPQAKTYPIFVPHEGDWIYTFTAEIDGQPVASTSITRKRLDSTVTVRPVETDGVQGTLYVPVHEQPLPTVLMLGGSEGGRPDFMASLLSSHGFAVLALSYFGEEGRPDALVEVPLETFDTALAWLAQQPEVDPQRLALWGASKGAEAGLITASRHSEMLCAVVAVAPSSVMWEGLPRNPMDMMNRAAITSSWTLEGKATPFVPQVLTTSDFMTYFSGKFATRKSFELGLADEAAVQAARIPVEMIDAPVLLIAGEDDQLWPSDMMAKTILSTRDKAELETDTLLFKEAGHALNAFYVPTLGLRDGAGLVLGGTPEGTAHASLEAWNKTLDFLAEHLKAPCH